MPQKVPAKKALLEFLLLNLGRVIEARELQEVAGFASEWARRVRELRNEQGYQILSHKDRASLKPGQYLMETDKRVPAFARTISKETRAYVLERNGYTCQMCGAGAGDEDPFNPARKLRLTIAHIIDKSKGGEDDPSNLVAQCTNCNEGLQNAGPPKPDLNMLLGHIRRATKDNQKHVLEWLLKKFPKSEG